MLTRMCEGRLPHPHTRLLQGSRVSTVCAEEKEELGPLKSAEAFCTTMLEKYVQQCRSTLGLN